MHTVNQPIYQHQILNTQIQKQYPNTQYQIMNPQTQTNLPLRYIVPPQQIHTNHQNKFVRVPLQIAVQGQGSNQPNKTIDINLNININDLQTHHQGKPQIHLKMGNNQPQTLQIPRNQNIPILRPIVVQNHRVGNPANFKMIPHKINNISPQKKNHNRNVEQIQDLLNRQDQDIHYQPPPPKQIQLITCVICKQKYDVNNINLHAQKHKKHYEAPKIRNSKVSYSSNQKQNQLKPNYKPIFQPQECFVKQNQDHHYQMTKIKINQTQIINYDTLRQNNHIKSVNSSNNIKPTLSYIQTEPPKPKSNKKNMNMSNQIYEEEQITQRINNAPQVQTVQIIPSLNNFNIHQQQFEIDEPMKKKPVKSFMLNKSQKRFQQTIEI